MIQTNALFANSELSGMPLPRNAAKDATILWLKVNASAQRPLQSLMKLLNNARLALRKLQSGMVRNARLALRKVTIFRVLAIAWFAWRAQSSMNRRKSVFLPDHLAIYAKYS